MVVSILAIRHNGHGLLYHSNPQPNEIAMITLETASICGEPRDHNCFFVRFCYCGERVYAEEQKVNLKPQVAVTIDFTPDTGE
jgi:hypothetical protein